MFSKAPAAAAEFGCHAQVSAAKPYEVRHTATSGSPASHTGFCARTAADAAHRARVAPDSNADVFCDHAYSTREDLVGSTSRDVVRKLFVGFALLMVSQGCGDDDRADFIGETGEFEDTDGDGGTTGRRILAESTDEASADTDTGGLFGNADSDGGADASNEPGAPVVEMIAPVDESDPVDVYQENLDVQCLILDPEGGGSELDTSTVLFQLLDADGEELASAVGERGDDPDIFEVTFPVQNVDPGRVRVRCSATDDSSEPNEASAQADTFVDHGPNVSIVSPEEGAAESALGDVVFEYEITPDKLKSGDDEADVDEVTLSILGLDFPMSEVDDDPGVYRTAIDFTDSTLFDDVPTGVLQINVSASNLRGIVKSTRYEFVLDGEGPEVRIKSPANTSIVGGTVVLELEVTDASGTVDWDSLRVQLNDVTFPYDIDGPWALSGDTIRFTFESRSITGSVVQLNLNVLVRDEAGNESTGASALYYRDEQPPIVSMDPPNFRQIRDGNPNLCSIPFDPIGDDAVANGDRVIDIETYRALVWEQTNDAGGDTLYFAGADTQSVDLFARRAGEPLVVDTTGDDVCDDIAEGDDIRFQQLTALEPTTVDPPYMADYMENVSPLVSLIGCDPGTAEELPDTLCDNTSDMYTVPYRGDDLRDEAIVYAVSPDRDSSDPDCTGRQWELRSAGLTGYQGWVCLAVRAYDKVGNRGVSPPIAVCLDNDQVDGAPDCWLSDEAPPDCTDGCDRPAELGAGGVVYWDE